MNPLIKLNAELSQARMTVAGKRFDEAPEGFKNIEAIKVRIRHTKLAYRRENPHAGTQKQPHA